MTRKHNRLAMRPAPASQLSDQHPDQAQQLDQQAQNAQLHDSQVQSPDRQQNGQPASPAAQIKGILPASTKDKFNPADYIEPFLKTMTDHPTVYHFARAVEDSLEKWDFSRISERDRWTDKLKPGGKYFFNRNGSGVIAFVVGDKFKAGNGAAIVGSHIDALTTKVKPFPKVSSRNGFLRLGIANYAGALNQTWFDRDLSIGGRVFIRTQNSNHVETKLVKLDRPIARIPTIAPHFGIRAEGQANRETRMTPIIGLDDSDSSTSAESQSEQPLGESGSFIASQPPRLVKAIAGELNISDYSSIVNWELELYDSQPAQLGGLDKELIFAGRIDDKLCAYAAVAALVQSPPEDSGIVKIVGLFDDEEIGSLLRQGARSNFLSSTIERINAAFADDDPTGHLYQTYANSFLVSADVIHAYNPNYDDVYLDSHSPRLNVGVAVSYDPNGHMTTDGPSTTLLHRVAEKSGSKLQAFQIRNDSRSGGTIGPMTSARTGIRAIDAGIPQLSMHSIRATTGSLDPGLGVKLFKGFFDHFESVDEEFR